VILVDSNAPVYPVGIPHLVKTDTQRGAEVPNWEDLTSATRHQGLEFTQIENGGAFTSATSD
jgi:hypothetical protein